MEDIPYSSQNIAAQHRPVFEQLVSFFPEFEVWQRHEDFHRWLSAGIVNRAVGAAVTVKIVRNSHTRSQLLTAEELARIKQHLTSEQNNDLSL